jgi:hypothetical protein
LRGEIELQARFIVARVIKIPIANEPDARAVGKQVMSGGNLSHALEQRLVAQIRHYEPAVHGGMVPTRRNTGRKQRFDLGGDIDGVADLSVEQRLDAETVAGG